MKKCLFSLVMAFISFVPSMLPAAARVHPLYRVHVFFFCDGKRDENVGALVGLEARAETMGFTNAEVADAFTKEVDLRLGENCAQAAEFFFDPRLDQACIYFHVKENSPAVTALFRKIAEVYKGKIVWPTADLDAEGWPTGKPSSYVY